MSIYDPIGRDRFAFLKGQSRVQQYRLILSFYGVQPHGRDTSGNQCVLLDRIKGTQAFVEALNDLYGNVISPIELTTQNFMDVTALWHQSEMGQEEFALRAKVAAWLCDLLVDQDVSPYHQIGEMVK